MPALLDSNAPNQLFGYIIQKRNPNSGKYEARSSMNHVMTNPNIVSIVVLILEISFMTHRILYIYLAANVWSSVIHQVHAKVVPIQAEEECRAMAAHICAIKFEKKCYKYMAISRNFVNSTKKKFVKLTVISNSSGRTMSSHWQHIQWSS